MSRPRPLVPSRSRPPVTSVLIPALLAAGAVSVATAPAPVRAQDAAEPPTPATAVIFLVRHAEKAARLAEDPPLAEEGRIRAADLASLLADAGLDAVWSTDWRRTRATAWPVAARTGLTVELYDPRDLAAFATTLLERGGRALVVGHSNTTPALVEVLGGEPGPPIDEASEYDRLYVVTATPGGAVTTVLRFGRTRAGG